MVRLHVLEVDPRSDRAWRLGRGAALAGLAALVVALVAAPPVGLVVLWDIVVPLLPVSFFVAPALWRGLCPLSTLNAWGNRLGPARTMTEREATVASALGLVLFTVIVPARHLGLNSDGALLAGVLIGIAAIAIAMGAAFESRSAFCNALCPVLPVERLYGQRPAVAVTRGRCARCTVCTPRGCLDLAESKAMPQLLGAARHDHGWLHTPFGIFAAALPGFIVGYGLSPDVGLDGLRTVYGATLLGAAMSWTLVSAAVRLTGAKATQAMAACAALAGLLYYWFAAAVISRDLGLTSAATATIRVAAIVGSLAWLARSHGVRRR